MSPPRDARTPPAEAPSEERHFSFAAAASRQSARTHPLFRGARRTTHPVHRGCQIALGAQPLTLGRRHLPRLPTSSPPGWLTVTDRYSGPMQSSAHRHVYTRTTRPWADPPAVALTKRAATISWQRCARPERPTRQRKQNGGCLESESLCHSSS
eukprot:2819269-Prymnesium_polylepis.1